MTMKGLDLRAAIEDLGLLVLASGATGLYVRTSAGRQIAFYDLSEDLAFRFGWVEFEDGGGRIDCLSWLEFYAELQEVTR